MLRIVLMGVAGCGKSSVGEMLAERMAVPYIDGDDLHPAENVDKMREGIALTDDDRWPWLDRVAAELNEQAPMIIGCSALKRAYRDRIRDGAGGPVLFVHLAGSKALITERMSARQGHYMPVSLIDSQFAALEAPGPDEDSMTVDIDQPLAAIVDTVQKNLKGREE
jgi:gluconokinase